MTDHPDYIHVGGGDPSLYNEDLAPVPHQRRNWGAFEIFNVWNNDIQSLFGYTLAASLFLSYGLNGWLTFAASATTKPGFVTMCRRARTAAGWTWCWTSRRGRRWR